MAEVSAKSFLGLLQKSGLCDQAELKASINDLFQRAGGGSIKLVQLTEHLLEAGLISDWHVKKLLSGKYKGYFLGKYKLIRHLGTGGMSTVYLAQHTIFNQQRAIKVLPRARVDDKTYLERFYREGRAAAALNHRNIVRVYDIGNEGDTHYLVMEYVKGEDISMMVKNGGPLDFGKAIDYTIQALTGLQHAHENDLVHRDIKPANLLVTPDGDVKILDLGLALFQEEDTSLTVMNNERVLGTADYLSPEQAVDSHNVDRRSDIYSTGCTLYFMLTGKPPFHEGTIAQRIAMHQSREPQDIRDFRSDCPDDLLAVVHKMMKKKPEDRFQDCETLAAELRVVNEGLLAGVPGIAVEKAQSTARSGKKSVTQSSPKQSSPKQSSPKQSSPKPPNSDPEKRKSKKTKPPASRKSQSENQTEPKRQSPPEPVNKPAAKLSNRVKQKPQPTARPVAATAKVRKDKTKSSPKNQPVSVGRKPHVEAADVTVIVPDDNSQPGQVDVQEFRSFVAQNRTMRKASVKPKRSPARDQLMMAGLVIAMLLLLGLVLWIAMNFVNAKESSLGHSRRGQEIAAFIIDDLSPETSYNRS